MTRRFDERSPRERVVITGMGIHCPIGQSRGEVWASLVEGKSGTGPIARFDASDLDSQIAGEVSGFDPRVYLGAKEARRADRYVQLAVAAGHDACEHADLEINDSNADRIGVLIGTAMGGMETIERELGVLTERGPGRVSPFFVPMYLGDMASGYLSIVLGARGPNFAPLSACASAAHAIGESAEMIRRGAADVMIAGGSEAAVTRGSVAGFAALQALSTRNDEPETASRPFDATRDGFVIGEGAGVLVLESLAHAIERGAMPLAEISGYGATADASHIVQPDAEGAGAARAMRIAIDQIGVEAGEIDYINAHGTSTPMNDRLESLSIYTVFGANGCPPTSSTKALTGHLLGAGGGIEAVFTVEAILHETLPPTWHYEHADPDCRLDYVTDGPRSAVINHAISNSLGFGGHNVSLAISRFNDE
ncbi:MAG: beta-ketoacyl-ACP synthase II [Thermomicrobiaceae bacterium]